MKDEILVFEFKCYMKSAKKYHKVFCGLVRFLERHKVIFWTKADMVDKSKVEWFMKKELKDES